MHPGAAKPVVQPLPKVIEKPPAYGSVPNLKWGDDDGGDDFIRRLLEWVPDPVRDVLRPVVEHAFRMGKVAEVYPFPQQHYLNSLPQAWMAMTSALSTAESGLDNTQVDALAAVLAESMTIPDEEREALRRRRHAALEAGEKGESTGTKPTEPAGSGDTSRGPGRPRTN
ncbi:hypothetical protein ABT116_23655 [Streptomyces sp. NPDC002130]|uniref:hypothetical protein n=1 Tax=Streptomyces sp. NPDC002130 TaxID=3155568 RepID=UPI0033349D73